MEAADVSTFTFNYGQECPELKGVTKKWEKKLCHQRN
jgi:hypothetical protein